MARVKPNMDKIYFQKKLIDGMPLATFKNFPGFIFFSNNYFGQTKDRDFLDKLEKIFNRKIAYLNQIHGTEIKLALRGGNLGDGDGLILTDNILGAVFTADCLPIALSDSAGIHTAILHAGWKGSLAGIALKAVNSLKENGAKELIAVLGPAAQACCYQVKENLLSQFMTSWPQIAPMVFRKNNKHLYLDLPLFNQLLLEDAGVRVYSSRICTICSREYHSYRRNKTDLRQITLVGSRRLS